MKRHLRIQFSIILFLTVIVSFVALAPAQIRIEIIHPKEGSQVIAADSAFIFGNIKPVDANLIINNRRPEMYPNGAFIAYVPVTPGRFSFICQGITAQDKTTVIRTVYIPPYLKSSPIDSLVIDTSYVFPGEDCVLQAGDVLKVAVKGTPGCTAKFSIDGLISDLQMPEIPPKKSFYWGEAQFGEGTNPQMKEVRGIYTGAYTIKPWDWAFNRTIRFQLADDFGNVVETTAFGRLTIENSAVPKIAELTQDVIIARSEFRFGSQLFLSKGTRVIITGRRGNYLRCRLAETDETWISQENMEILRPGTPLPEGIVTDLQTENLERYFRIKVKLDQRLPFRVEQTWKPAALWITFYGIKSNADRVVREFDDLTIRQIRWEQTTRNSYQLKIKLSQNQQWGYNPYYENGNFCLDIKKPPTIEKGLATPFKGLTICLDPGHSPETGAIGPKGHVEKDLNYSYCVALAKELEMKGAVVVLTRGEKDGATLAARTQTALFMEADILLSLHFNALPDGADPFKNRGIGTYYYHPHAHRFAQLIQKKLVKYTRLQNFGLFNDKLAVCRSTQMIAVLAEPGFLIHPWEEILIVSEFYREKVVKAIVDALAEFLTENK